MITRVLTFPVEIHGRYDQSFLLIHRLLKMHSVKFKKKEHQKGSTNLMGFLASDIFN